MYIAQCSTSDVPCGRINFTSSAWCICRSKKMILVTIAIARYFFVQLSLYCKGYIVGFGLSLLGKFNIANLIFGFYRTILIFMCPNIEITRFSFLKKKIVMMHFNKIILIFATVFSLWKRHCIIGFLCKPGTNITFISYKRAIPDAFDRSNEQKSHKCHHNIEFCVV